jgi:hypothetical protein
MFISVVLGVEYQLEEASLDNNKERRLDRLVRPPAAKRTERAGGQCDQSDCRDNQPIATKLKNIVRAVQKVQSSQASRTADESIACKARGQLALCAENGQWRAASSALFVFGKFHHRLCV